MEKDKRGINGWGEINCLKGAEENIRQIKTVKDEEMKNINLYIQDFGKFVFHV